MRDDFPKATIETLAKRVGQRCSNPSCRKTTSGPHTDPSKAVVVRVAAHITEASPGGPRYEKGLSPDQRSAIDNGIWLCQTCSKLLDSDQARYPVEELFRWKERAELSVSQEVESCERKTHRLGEMHPEDHSIRLAVDDWTVWRERRNLPGDRVIFISPWTAGDICYSCVIRLRNNSVWEEQLHRLRVEFLRGQEVILSDEYAFGDQEVVLPPRKWVSLELGYGLHDEFVFTSSDSVWFAAETVGDNEKLAWRLAALMNP
jgi:hypothetical protein